MTLKFRFGDYEFDGHTYVAVRDKARLNHQLLQVVKIMLDGAWHTLPEISNVLGYPQQSISARLRDLRKPRFGGHEVVRQNIGGGLFQYKFVPNKGEASGTDRSA